MISFEQFKEEQLKKDPSLLRSSEPFLRQLYESHIGKAETDRITAENDKALREMIVTTETIPPFPIEKRIDIVSAECALGMNIFRDILAGLTDVFGGRSEATQNILRDARVVVLKELRKEAYNLGANGVIGVTLNYSEFSGGGKSMLFIVATGTAVKFSTAVNII